jgi:hypothetical protein
MGIEQIVNVSISRETVTIDQAGFGRALILGDNMASPDILKLYTSLAAVAEDFETTDEEYLAATALFSQERKPVDVLIGKRGANVAQVDIVTVEQLANLDYVVTINGTDFTYTPGGVPADKSTVAAALMAAINAGTEQVTASLSGSAPNETLTLTADNAGEPFTLAVTATILSYAVSVEDEGVASALDDIVASGVLGDSWYALMLTSRENVDIIAAAAWIEARRKIFIACSDDTDIISSASDDIASQLQGRAYARTAILYSGDDAKYPEAAWLGVGLTLEPGTMTYSLKTLAGILYDDLSASEIAYAKAKGANYYVEIGGVNLTQNGNMAEGEWIDVITGIDWIQARASENIFATVVVNNKIPFTDSGIDQIVNPLRQILQQAVDRKILDSFTITQPLASSFTAVQKQSRNLTGISFDGTLAGAVHAVTITGTVHV